MEIFKKFTFDSAHYLPNVHEGHKCRHMHGHTYHLTIYLKGEPLPHEGWIADFADVKNLMKPILKQIDHKVLNDIPGLENPTCELFGEWLWQRISVVLPALSKLELYETPTSGAVITREGR